MLQVARLSLRGRNWLCVVIVSIGVLSLILGVLQLSHTGGFEWCLYSQCSRGFLVGFQANRNAQADILIAGILASGVLAISRLGDGRHHILTWTGLSMVILAFLIGLLMTGSRTGIALSVTGLLFLGVMLWPVLLKRTAILYWVTGSVGLLIVSGTILMPLQSVQKVVARFSIVHEARWDLWADTWYAIGQVWPYGSGIGTIVPMLEAAERLEVVDTSLPVRAHNDWLEWTLEAGAPGLVILGAIIIGLVFLAARALILMRRPDVQSPRRAQVIFSLGVLMTEGLHAIVDYPTRSMSLAAIIAVAVALLMEPAESQPNRP
jgi:hypothetical protein